METPINGIVINGTFYKAVIRKPSHLCKTDCALYDLCQDAFCKCIEQIDGESYIFIESEILTEKLMK